MRKNPRVHAKKDLAPSLRTPFERADGTHSTTFFSFSPPVRISLALKKEREREISSIFDPLFPQSTLSLLFKHVLLMHRAYCLLPCLSTHSISYIYIYIFIVDQETDQSHRSNRYLKRILLYNSIIRSPWIFLNSSQIRDERKGGKEESLTGWDGAKAYSSLSIILPNDHWIEFRFSSQFSRTSKR